MIAGFDPSITHLGWTIFDEYKEGKESVVAAGTFQTRPLDGLLVQRLITQRERVRQLIHSFKINFVSMEAPYWQDFSTELLFALNQHLHEVFLDEQIFVIYIQPQTLKKYALPDMAIHEITKHNMSHQAKIELNRMGKRLSEHVADAYFAGKIGHKFYNWYFLHKYKDSDLSPMEYDLFCGKHTFVKGVKKGLTEYKGIIHRENDQFFDYRKQSKNSKNLAEEIKNGFETNDNGRIF